MRAERLVLNSGRVTFDSKIRALSKSGEAEKISLSHLPPPRQLKWTAHLYIKKYYATYLGDEEYLTSRTLTYE